MFEHHKKESPIISLAGVGGGPSSYIFYSAAGGGDEISRALRFNSGDGTYLNKTPSQGSRQRFTWSGWVKKGTYTSNTTFFSAGSDGSNRSHFMFDGTLHQLRFFDLPTSTGLVTTDVFQDLNAWYHLVLAVDTTQGTAANRVKFYVNGRQITDFSSETYPGPNANMMMTSAVEHRIGSGIAYGEHFDGYLADVHLVDGSQLDASSFGSFDSDNVWQPKAYGAAHGTAGFHLKFDDTSTNSALGTDSAGSNDFAVYNLISQANSLDSFKVYGNATNSGYSGSTNIGSLGTLQGSNVTSFDTGSTAYNGVTLDFNTVGNHSVYAFPFLDASSANVNVYISDNGTSWTAITKGQTPYTFTGRYIQWGRTGSGYGDQYFRSASGFENVDSVIDTPSNQTPDSGNNVGNYATLNPLRPSTSYQGVFSNGNLKFLRSGSGYASCTSSVGMKTGKWYCEFTKTRTGTNVVAGIIDETPIVDYFDRNSGGYGWRSDGVKTWNNASHGNIGGYQPGDVLGMAFDADAKAVYFYKNGSQVGSYTGMTSTPSDGYWFFAWSAYDGAAVNVNFGQKPFTHTPPTNYKPLCSTDQTQQTITNGADHIGISTWRGNGGTQTVTGYNFSPDFVWIKDITNGATDYHVAIDVLRGGTDVLFPSEPIDSETQSGAITQFNSDGYNLGSWQAVNRSNRDFVGWGWNADTAESTNDDGSVQSQIRKNTAAGFSIVKYSYTGTGAQTVGHGLGAVPDVVWRKPINLNESWSVYAAVLGWGNRTYLDGDAATSGTTTFSSSAPSSTVTRINNSNTGNYVEYVFRQIQGYSRFGAYSAQSTLNGPFIYTGFKSSFVMIRRTDAANNWVIYDSERDKGNKTSTRIYPDLNDGGNSNTSHYIDITSNGFKINSPDGALLNKHTGSGNYFYMAFAEHPLRNARAR